MADQFQDKTEEASPKKLADARKKGQVARSAEFTGAVLLLVSMIVLYFFASFLNNKLQYLSTAVFSNLLTPYDSVASVTFWFRRGLLFVVLLGLPLLAGVFVVAFMVNALQVGLTVAGESIRPKWKNSNPFEPENYKKLFNSQLIMRSFLGLGKIALVSFVCSFSIMKLFPSATILMNGSVSDIYRFLGQQSFMLGLFIALLLVVLGGADLIFQKWKFRKDMRMTPQEVKDEQKQTEGDMILKSKMRSMGLSLAQKGMKDKVLAADFVIADTEDYVIAIKYDAQQESAPLCLAKGARYMAITMKEIALQKKIPIVENGALARELYRVAVVDHPIPSSCYHPVAEVVATVYQSIKKSL